MRRLLLVSALCALLGTFPASAPAITAGQPDGNAHPYVAYLDNGVFACSGTLMLPANNQAKSLLVQAPMAIPHWGAHRHRHSRFRPARTMRGGRNLLFLPVQNAFCIQSSFFAFSGNSCRQRILHIFLFCTLSHSPQFAPRQAKGLLTSWSTFNHFCHRRFGAIGN